ncbi:hypothetical protein [Paraburkholderia kururiensis]|uniref:hypothetical protein n=1 Tax=Paraburkholderia kururiensis TaxID=984307 RepID=UPI0013875EF1|nr:hypothetical protein [Paraburkholderia kururiensis]
MPQKNRLPHATDLPLATPAPAGRAPDMDLGAPPCAARPQPCPASDPVSIQTMHAALTRGQLMLLHQLGRCALGDDAFLVALLVVPLLDSSELRRLPEANLRTACGLNGARWNHAIDELVRLGALRRIWPRSPNRPIAAFRLATCLRVPVAACASRTAPQDGQDPAARRPATGAPP